VLPRSFQLAHAKLNLGLRILGRRADGYHLISSLFVPIELADRISIDLGGGDLISLEINGVSDMPNGRENLAVRAAEAYMDLLGTRRSLMIGLHKLIPIAAGLGGGSSDAAAVLHSLQELVPGVSKTSLLDIAQDLGSDISFFLRSPLTAAWVSGVGEVVEPVRRDLPNLFVVIVNPGLPLLTERVFKTQAALSRRDSALTPEIKNSRLSTVEALQDFSSGDLSEALLSRLVEVLGNDLEPSALELCPQISRLRQKMVKAGAEIIGLSGSGPSLYALFSKAEESHQFAKRLEPLLDRGERYWCTRFLSTS